MGAVPSALYQPFPMEPGRRAQLWRHHPRYRRPRHFHAEPELNVVVEGSGKLAVGDHCWTVAPGDALLFHPGQDHVLLDGSDDFELFVMALSPELAARAGGSRWLCSGGRAQLPPQEVGALRAALNDLTCVHDREAVEQQLVGLFHKASAAPATTRHVLSRRAAQILPLELAVSAGELAARLGTAPSGISRHFHADTGIRLVEYRARLRLMTFIALVDQGLSFSRAALDADFGSYAQCHRVFSRALGCSPRDYFGGLRARIDAQLDSVNR